MNMNESPLQNTKRSNSNRRMGFKIGALITALIFFSFLLSGGLAMIIYYLFVSFSEVTTMKHGTWVFIAISFFSAVIISSIIFVLISRYLFTPLSKIINALKKIAKGDFSVRVHTKRGTKEMKALEKSFNNMADELEGMEIFKNDFISNFSHEFKTPIVSVRGFAKQLKNKDLSDEQRDEYIDIIVSESDRLAQMSSNILLLTRFENQQIVTNKTVFFLDEQIRKSILLLERDWSKKGLELDLDLQEIKYFSNEEIMTHIWINILNNAIKFSNDGGTIHVGCHTDGTSAIVTIRDEGIGMTDDVRHHIFDKFYQGDRSHSLVGNGLGLSLAKTVVDLVGGEISVKSKPDEGSTFIVRLPDVVQ